MGSLRRAQFAALCTAAAIGVLSASTRATEPTNLAYQGGTTLTSPRIFVVFWNFTSDDPANAKPTVTGLVTHIGDTKYLGTTEIYTAGGTERVNADETGDMRILCCDRVRGRRWVA